MQSPTNFFTVNHLLAILPAQLGIFLPRHPRSVVRSPKAPAYPRVSMRAGPSALTPVSIASAHCPPAPVCAPIECPVPIALHNLPAWRMDGRSREKQKMPIFWNLLMTPPPNFFARKTIRGPP